MQVRILQQNSDLLNVYIIYEYTQTIYAECVYISIVRMHYIFCIIWNIHLHTIMVNLIFLSLIALDYSHYYPLHVF